MKRILLSLLLPLVTFSALAEPVNITSVDHINLGSRHAGSGAMIGGVAGAVAGDSWGDIAIGALGGAIIGDVVSDHRQGVKISIEHADGRQRVVVQQGDMKQFRLGEAELEEIHHGADIKFEVRPNRS
ncbi:hypothetical protein [Shewanella sp. UCD-KL12]|uniref:hypothetical protein n=1 Tax=Shewanella sp. UCD-KL12 TaxID=1917163 RepID=UPI000970FD3E|nr:hypothetical protein [Shewanella sp. UCD-KL12]